MSQAPNTTTSPQAPQRQASSPEALDQITETTTTHGWWALLAIAVAVGLAIIWSFIATIPQQVKATGVISSFNYSAMVAAPIGGIVTWDSDAKGELTPDTTVAMITPFDGSAPVKVKAGFAGSISSLYAMEGSGVEPGQDLATVVTTPDPSEGIVVVTYVSEADALTYTVGQNAQVAVTEIDSGKTFVTQGEIMDVGASAANQEGMLTVSGSRSLSEMWMNETDGLPFRVVLDLKDWPADHPSGIPGPGQIVDITNTYGSIHPINLLFGGN